MRRAAYDVELSSLKTLFMMMMRRRRMIGVDFQGGGVEQRMGRSLGLQESLVGMLNL